MSPGHAVGASGYEVRHRLTVKAQLGYMVLFLMVVALAILPAAPALADEPHATNVDVPLIYAFQHVLQPNDTLVTAYYSLTFTSYPNVTVDRSFVFRLLYPNNTVLATNYAYPYANSGYGEGVVSWYFDNTTALDWGTLYKVQVLENIVTYPSGASSWQFPFSASAYQNGTTQAAQRAVLATRILEMSYSLGLAWSVTMVDPQDAGNFLSSIGELYWRNVIAGVQVMAPTVFYLQELAANWTMRTWNVSQVDVYAGLYNGTWVYNATASMASLFGWSHQMLLTLPLMFVLGVVFWVSNKRWSDADPAFLSAFIIAAGGTVMGFVGMVLQAVLAFLMVAWLGYYWFFQRS